jgi:glucosylceramidase
MMRTLMLLVGVLGVAHLSAQNGSPRERVTLSMWMTTTKDNPWHHHRDLSPRDAKECSLNISTKNVRQAIEGFGGCFNELGWRALQSLSKESRQQILKDLFDPTEGVGFSLCRMPVAANDYSLEWYSYDETPDDFELEHFSIEHDTRYLIPYIKSALQYNPSLRLWASPWSPPSWMKTNNSYACQSSEKYNTLAREQSGREMHTLFRMEGKYLEVYALYFSKFIKAYAEHGISVSSVHVQNEPNSCQIFPSCIWEPKDLALFIGRYLGPTFQKEKIPASIWLGTIERPQPERVTDILQNEDAARYIKGVGFQWAGKELIRAIHNLYPDLNLMQTETECGDGSNDWSAMVHTFNLIRHYFDSGARAYMYWNMVLADSGLSTWGWKQNSMITIGETTKKVCYNPEFYLMKHLGYFVKPGFRKLEITGQYEDAVAFLDASSKIVLILLNDSSQQKNIALNLNESLLTLSLDPWSLNTICFELRD